MNIYPAIDLRYGKVVRLKHGDPRQQRTYGDDPIETARRWAAEGAQWIHVVNLDGAFGDEAGAAINRSLLQSIATAGSKIQFGGGLRSITDIEAALVRGRLQDQPPDLHARYPELFFRFARPASLFLPKRENSKCAPSPLRLFYRSR